MADDRIKRRPASATKRPTNSLIRVHRFQLLAQKPRQAMALFSLHSISMCRDQLVSIGSCWLHLASVFRQTSDASLRRRHSRPTVLIQRRRWIDRNTVHPISHWLLLVVVGCCWLLLVVVGCSCLLLVPQCPKSVVSYRSSVSWLKQNVKFTPVQ